MSLVEDECKRQNAIRAEERRLTEIEFMAEQARKSEAVKKIAPVVLTVEVPVQDGWKRRWKWWSQVLEQQKKHN